MIGTIQQNNVFLNHGVKPNLHCLFKRGNACHIITLTFGALSSLLTANQSGVDGSGSRDDDDDDDNENVYHDDNDHN